MVETQENVDEYHSVFANSLLTVFQAILNKKETEARKLLISMVRYVYTTIHEEEYEDDPSEIIKQLDKMNLDNLDLDNLIVYTAYYQSKAGMKPVQTKRSRAGGYHKIKTILES